MPRSSSQASSIDGPIGPRFIGRFDRSDPAAARCAWPGAAITLRFTGRAIGVTLTDTGNNWFEVVIDGQHRVLSLERGTKKYALGEQLSDGPHDLLLYRRTEPSFGETAFNGFDLDAGAYLPGPPVPKRRIEVIGDSISAGYGNEGTLAWPFEPGTENHYLTYGAITAREVGAELYTEAWSGIGLIRNYDGTTQGTMLERYPRILPEQASSRWDFSSFTPDVLLINLGSNDFAKGDPGQAFETAYEAFVGELRAHYPKARFYLAIGPTLSGSSYEQAEAYLTSVIAARARLGDSDLALLTFAVQDAKSDGLGCDYHPSLKTHRKMADKLVATLHGDLGW